MEGRTVLSPVPLLLLVIASWLITTSDANQCGEVKVFRQGLIFGGTSTVAGMWPWHVALFHRETARKTEYKCGATIVNKDTVLTAMHCVVDNNFRFIPANRLLVKAGVFDVTVSGPTVQEHQVFEVLLSPGANVAQLLNDIAILRLRTELTYDDWVQPICVSTVDQNIAELTGEYGTIVGWGLTEALTTSATLRQASIPVVSADQCLESDRQLFSQVLTTKIYCAGNRNGTASCKGDSGGGMYFKQGGFWYLRGITSFSTTDPESPGQCNARGYVGYTDVNKFMQWMANSGVQLIDPLKRQILKPPPSQAGKGNETIIRLAVDANTKKLLQSYNRPFLMKVVLNGKRKEFFLQ